MAVLAGRDRVLEQLFAAGFASEISRLWVPERNI
jgi:hypothetical protein